MRHLFTAVLFFTMHGAMPMLVEAQSARDKAVRLDKQELSDDGLWFYDDFESAREAALRSKKPLLIVFR